MANSDKKIVYENDEGGISIIWPADNCGLTVEEIHCLLYTSPSPRDRG